MRMPGGWKASSPACTAAMSTPRACAAAAAASALVTLWRPGTASRIVASRRSTTRRNSVPSSPPSTMPWAPTVTPAAGAVPNGTLRPGKARADALTRGSSAFTTAVAEGRWRR